MKNVCLLRITLVPKIEWISYSPLILYLGIKMYSINRILLLGDVVVSLLLLFHCDCRVSFNKK